MIPAPHHWRVEIEWEDSTLIGGSWQDIPDILAKRKDAPRCLSVGFVLADDKQGVVLASSIHDGQATGVTVIPRSAIRSKRRIGQAGA